jgi:hypothetical protein
LFYDVNSNVFEGNSRYDVVDWFHLSRDSAQEWEHGKYLSVRDTWGISSSAEGLLPFQEGLCYMEEVI